MGHLRSSFVLLLLLGLLCVANSNPISGLFGKSDDGKAAEEEKDVKDAAEPTTTTTATTPTPTPAATTSPSCSGLSSFFHLCDKNEPTEPPKKAKRDASEEDDSDSDEGDNDDDDDEATTASNSEADVAKRQVGDPEAPVLGEVPPVLKDAMTPETSDGQEEDKTVKRRQTEVTVEDDDDDADDDDDEEEEMEETSRRRRDCRDEGGKDCRRKREYVPTCLGAQCRKEGTTAAAATETA